jgi:DNA-binding protein HU-beta/integration host factor subunit beta
MIKADIVRKISEKLGKKDKEALQIVDEIFECFKDVIVEKGRLEVRDFGVFQVKRRKSRIGRNPRNKREYPIPERRVVTFKAGKLLKSKAVEIARAVAARELREAAAQSVRDGSALSGGGGAQ